MNYQEFTLSLLITTFITMILLFNCKKFVPENVGKKKRNVIILFFPKNKSVLYQNNRRRLKGFINKCYHYL